MNGISEPLPGLLDDPQFQLPDLPALTDFHIAPLRDPAPPRHLNAPLPLEPVTDNAINGARGSGSRPTPQTEPVEPRKTSEISEITPSDVLQARESKKPHLAISEIIEHNDRHGGPDGSDAPPVQLPSFVSLSVVEKSPVPSSLAITAATTLSSKRPRLEQETDSSAAHEFGRQLPRPPHKEQIASRPAPLLPAMVTGLHEPPPSAGLLPSIDLDQRPVVARKGTVKIQVKDILMDVDHSPALSAKLPPNALPASREPEPEPEPEPTSPSFMEQDQPIVDTTLPPIPPEKQQQQQRQQQRQQPPTQSKSDDKEFPVKTRRTRRPWTEAEAQDLLNGVSKHGVGRWKQILEDQSFHFNDRTTVDLKDRHRVSLKEREKETSAAAPTPTPPPPPPRPLITTTTKTKDSEQQSKASTADHSETPLATSPSTVFSPGSAPHRRKRRAWTPDEDERLIKGIQKHGFQWTNIHADPDLDLAHRRATDLRDRIRNKYPEGYRRAESAPLRSEMRKMEKPKTARTTTAAAAKKRRGLDNGGQQSSPTTTTTITTTASERTTRPLRVREKEKEKEKDQNSSSSSSNNNSTSTNSTTNNTNAGLTLPSLTLDDDNDAMDWDNTLPPLLEWDYLGNMGV